MITKKRFKILRYAILCLVVIFLFHPSRFSCSNYPVIPEERIESSLLKTTILWTESPLEKPLCPPLNFSILQQFDSQYYLTDPEWTSLNESLIAEKLDITPGGSWSPSECIGRYEAVIIIPYRDREAHLSTFIKYIHPFLHAQNMNYRIVVVEQTPERPFNRGKLFNVGFLESSIPAEFPLLQCVIFHDVDLIPLDPRNIYSCSDQPRHMSANIDTMRFNLPYEELFGGVISVPAYIYREVNGFSNRFFGWGAEDDDFKKHRLGSKFPIVRFPPEMSRYQMLGHKPSPPNPSRFKLLHEKVLTEEDGLSTTSYDIIYYETSPLYTKLIVDI